MLTDVRTLRRRGADTPLVRGADTPLVRGALGEPNSAGRSTRRTPGTRKICVASTRVGALQDLRGAALGVVAVSCCLCGVAVQADHQHAL